MKKLAFLFLAPLLAVSAWGGTEKPVYRRTMAVGVDYNGLLAKVGFKKAWSMEAHYMLANESSTDGDVKATLFGIRGYRYFHTEKRLQYFVGPEIASVATQSEYLKSSGYLAGAFIGVEYYLTRRITVGLDIGPYYTKLKETKTKTSNSGIDMILNSFLNFHFL